MKLLNNIMRRGTNHTSGSPAAPRRRRAGAGADFAAGTGVGDAGAGADFTRAGADFARNEARILRYMQRLQRPRRAVPVDTNYNDDDDDDDDDDSSDSDIGYCIGADFDDSAGNSDNAQAAAAAAGAVDLSAGAGDAGDSGGSGGRRASIIEIFDSGSDTDVDGDNDTPAPAPRAPAPRAPAPRAPARRRVGTHAAAASEAADAHTGRRVSNLERCQLLRVEAIRERREYATTLRQRAAAQELLTWAEAIATDAQRDSRLQFEAAQTQARAAIDAAQAAVHAAHAAAISSTESSNAAMREITRAGGRRGRQLPPVPEQSQSAPTLTAARGGSVAPASAPKPVPKSGSCSAPAPDSYPASAQGGGRCAICFTEPPNVAFACGHVCMCAGCLPDFEANLRCPRGEIRTRRCPICRAASAVAPICLFYC